VLDFLAAYPDIDIRLVLSDHKLNLLEDNVALAIRIGKLGDSSLIASRIGSSRVVVCASPIYLNSRGRRKSRTICESTTALRLTIWRRRTCGGLPAQKTMF
jgi:DNA-binding transcriptional LysR family regulator